MRNEGKSRYVVENKGGLKRFGGVTEHVIENKRSKGEMLSVFGSEFSRSGGVIATGNLGSSKLVTSCSGFVFVDALSVAGCMSPREGTARNASTSKRIARVRKNSKIDDQSQQVPYYQYILGEANPNRDLGRVA